MKFVSASATALFVVCLWAGMFEPAWARGRDAAFFSAAFALFFLAVPFIAAIMFRWAPDSAGYRQTSWFGFTPYEAGVLAIWSFWSAPRLVGLLGAYLSAEQMRVVNVTALGVGVVLAVGAVAFFMAEQSKREGRRRYGLGGPLGG